MFICTNYYQRIRGITNDDKQPGHECNVHQCMLVKMRIVHSVKCGSDDHIRHHADDEAFVFLSGDRYRAVKQTGEPLHDAGVHNTEDDDCNGAKLQKRDKRKFVSSKVEDHHERKNCEEGEQMDADRQADEIRNEQNIFLVPRFVRPVVPPQ